MELVKDDIVYWVLNKGVEDITIVVVSAIIATLIYQLSFFIVRRIIISTFTGRIDRIHETFKYVTSKITGNQSESAEYCSDEESYKIELEKRRDTILSILKTAIRVIVILVWVFYVLIMLGVSVMPLLAGTSIIGVALGFGAQNIVKDALAGFFIILENQIRIGDHIDLDAIGITRAKGVVEHISIRYVMIRDREGDAHFINNGSIVQIVNRTLGFSRALFSFTVPIGTDIENIVKIVDKVGETQYKDKQWHDVIQEKMHFKEVGDFIDGDVEIYVVGATLPGEQWHVADSYKRLLLAELQKHNIFISGKKED